MADSLYTTSLNVLIKNMVDGNFVRAKYVRRGIDNEKAAKNALKLDGDLLKRYNAFKKVVEKTDKKEAKYYPCYGFCSFLSRFESFSV